jgi:hypothetical protein
MEGEASMSIADALSRIGQIEQQLSQLQSGTLPSSSTASASTSTTGTTTAGTFSTALAQATGQSSSAFPTLTATSGTSSVLPSTLTGGAATGSGASLPAAATTMLTSNQQQFASQLSADTGLNPGVVSAWLLAEESGSAAQSRQSAGNNDWLNIGYTDSGTYGSSDSVWSDPVKAANATAGWLGGQSTIPGYGTASSGIQSILSAVGQTPAAQISALQGSGWASSGYPSLASLYTQVTQ